MPSRKSTDPESPPPDIPYETAIGELERILEAMESEQLPLEDLVACYEKGAGLLKQCETSLASARERIKLITLSPDELQDRPRKSLAPSEDGLAKAEPDDDDDNDISLF